MPSGHLGGEFPRIIRGRMPITRKGFLLPLLDDAGHLGDEGDFLDEAPSCIRSCHWGGVPAFLLVLLGKVLGVAGADAAAVMFAICCNACSSCDWSNATFADSAVSCTHRACSATPLFRWGLGRSALRRGRRACKDWQLHWFDFKDVRRCHTHELFHQPAPSHAHDEIEKETKPQADLGKRLEASEPFAAEERLEPFTHEARLG
eukprot:s2895_g3.t1